jgi:hypothetical protein
MKIQTLKKVLVVLSIGIVFSSCKNNDEPVLSKELITDFKASELTKMHGGSEKQWVLTQVIIPEPQKDYPTVPTNECVSDDTYTFKASATNESLVPLKVELGDNRCFKTVSDEEKFEASLLYVPYMLNGEEVIETTLILKYSRITNSDNKTVTNIDSYRLSELTEDRMVFSIGSEYVGEYTFAYVFEKK